MAAINDPALSWWLGSSGGGSAPSLKRTGIVRADGKCVRDDQGIFNPMGATLFWSLYGWMFERDRIVAHLDWLATKGIDYVRILCEVDWPTRTINPVWAMTESVLGEFLDACDARGFRVQLTLVGGVNGDKRAQGIAAALTPIVKKRPHTVIGFEICNEYERLDKMTPLPMVKASQYLRSQFPQHLIGLSCFVGDGEHAIPSVQWLKYMKDGGANWYILHLRRSSHDYKWSHVRQGYDFKNSDYPGDNNEPQGPQSSVADLDNPMQLAMSRVVSTVCGAPFYVLHVAQGVLGIADANHGRPANMWDVPNVDACFAAVRAVDPLLPVDVANWDVQNNAWTHHPMPLPGAVGVGFWEGNKNGSVNKNYAAVRGNEFCVALLGVHVNAGGADGQMVPVGTAKRRMVVRAYNVGTCELVPGSEQELQAGQSYQLPGRLDTMAGYLVRGSHL